MLRFDFSIKEISEKDGPCDNINTHDDVGQKYISLSGTDSNSLMYNKGQQL